MNIADKNYGFCITAGELVQEQMDLCVQPAPFQVASAGTLLYETSLLKVVLSWRMQLAVQQRLISARTCDCLLNPLSKLDLHDWQGDAEAKLLAGSLRTMPKLHKLPLIKFRRVEVDSKNPLVLKSLDG